MKRGKIVGNAIILAFFLFFLVDSLKLHEVRRFGEMGSGFWPILVLCLASILSGSLLISSLREKKGRKKGAEAEVSPCPVEEPAARRDQKKVVVLAAAITAVYIVAMQWIGFALATCLFVLGFVLVLGERRKWVLIISPVLVAALILAIFSRFIEIPFPRGIGAFAELSRFFY